MGKRSYCFFVYGWSSYLLFIKLGELEKGGERDVGLVWGSGCFSDIWEDFLYRGNIRGGFYIFFWS